MDYCTAIKINDKPLWHVDKKEKWELSRQLNMILIFYNAM